MNVNDIVTDTLKQTKLPIYPDFYEGEKDEYITFNYANDYTSLYSDNTPEVDYVQLQIHYFVRGKSPHAARKKIRSLLCKAGFDVSLGPINYENDTKKHHCVISAGIDGIAELEE